MKDLIALTIGGTPIQVPKEIQHIIDVNNSDTGSYGGKIIGTVIGIMLLVAVFMALGFILAGGFKWITSQGDPKQIEGARNTIIYAAIGLGIAVLSFYFVNLLGCFLNAPILGVTPCH